MMQALTREDIYQILKLVTEEICDQALMLCELDSVVGDGDHGTTIRRGVIAGLERMEREQPESLDQLFAVYALGMVSTMGGASGPIFSSLFLGMGMATKGADEMHLEHLIQAFDNGRQRIMKIGKAKQGDKTLLDALGPGLKALQQSYVKGEDLALAFAHMHEAALAGVEQTKQMVSRKGRSRYAGERGLGHADAGATSVSIIIGCFASYIKSKETCLN